MSSAKLLRLAVRNVTKRGKRTWLTIIGVFIGIAAVVALVSLGQGLEQSVIGEFEDLGADNLYVTGGEGFEGFFTLGLEERDVEVVERARGVTEAGGMYFQFGSQSEFRGEEQGVAVGGLPTGQSQDVVMEGNALEIDSGRNLRSADTNTIIIGVDIVDDVFDREVDIGSQITIEDQQFRVVGILEPTGDPAYDGAVYMNIDRAWDLFEDEGEIAMITAKVADGLEPEAVADEIERELRRDRGQAPGEEDFTVLTAGETVESFQNILNIVQAVVIGLASISLLVGAVGILNTMYMSVTERVKEIGVMKSIGATNAQVRNLFLMESGLIGLIGGIIGLILGAFLSEIGAFAVRATTEIPFSTTYPLSLISGTILFSFLIGALSGYLPAKTAYKLQPVEALRDD